MTSVYSAVNLESLRNRTRARFRELFISDSFDLFSLQDKDWPFLLYSLVTNWGANKRDPEILAYLEEVFDEHPEHLGRFLSHFFNMPDEFADLRVRQLEEIADPSEIVKWLDKYGERALGSTQARQAASLIRELAEQQGPKGDPKI